MCMCSFWNAGCCIAVGGPPGCRKPCVITVKCPGVCTVFMAVLDQIQLTLWYNALEQGTKTECLSKRINEKQRAKKDQGIVTVGELPQAKVKPEKRSDTSLPEIPVSITNVSLLAYGLML